MKFRIFCACKFLSRKYCSYNKGSIRKINSRRLTSRPASSYLSLRLLPEVDKLLLLDLRSEDEPPEPFIECLAIERLAIERYPRSAEISRDAHSAL